MQLNKCLESIHYNFRIGGGGADKLGGQTLVGPAWGGEEIKKFWTSLGGVKNISHILLSYLLAILYLLRKLPHFLSRKFCFLLRRSLGITYWIMVYLIVNVYKIIKICTWIKKQSLLIYDLQTKEYVYAWDIVPVWRGGGGGGGSKCFGPP